MKDRNLESGANVSEHKQNVGKRPGGVLTALVTFLCLAFAALPGNASAEAMFAPGPESLASAGILGGNGLGSSLLSTNTAVEIGEGEFLEITSDDVSINGVTGAGGVIVNVPASEEVLFAQADFTYSGLTVVESGRLSIYSELSQTAGLVLYGGTSVFNRSSFSLDGKSLTVISSNGEGATYDGHLSAQNANLNFVLEAPLADSYDGYMLEVNGTANISGSTVNVYLDGSVNLASTREILLMRVLGTLEGGDGVTLGNSNGKSTVQIGSTIRQTGDMTLHLDEGGNAASLYLEIGESGTQVVEGAKSLPEGNLTGLMLTLQGADLVAGRGMRAAMDASRESEDVTFTPFATVSGSSMRYNTGSHSDMNSFNLLTGLVAGKRWEPGRLVVGAFFEYGTGSYSTYNSFSSGSYSGDGNAYYMGGGILARMDFSNLGQGHFYVEGSARMGGLHNSYANDDLRDGYGRSADYDTYSPYYSFHVGLGYHWDINEQATLEFYGKYLWTRESGDCVELSTGETVDFEDIDSSRLRFGTRFDYIVNEFIKPYIGIAWEHEFDGVSRSTTNGLPISATSLRGDTGLGEIGIAITPSDSVPLTVDFGVTGYVGTREGISGSLLFTYTF